MELIDDDLLFSDLGPEKLESFLKARIAQPRDVPLFEENVPGGEEEQLGGLLKAEKSRRWQFHHCVRWFRHI